MILEDAKIDEERKRGHEKEQITMTGDPKLADKIGQNRKYLLPGLSA